jgi:2-keto-4-pentenoate hydratase/2-oxohepta-3-ene-1,7-dioic acid hydratase in catechol pathway
MKLLRYGEPGAEKPAILDADGAIRDLSGHVSDIGGKEIDPAALPRWQSSIPSLPLVAGTPRIGPCVTGTGKFICIGLNYSDHAAESGARFRPSRSSS